MSSEEMKPQTYRIIWSEGVRSESINDKDICNLIRSGNVNKDTLILDEVSETAMPAESYSFLLPILAQGKVEVQTNTYAPQIKAAQSISPMMSGCLYVIGISVFLGFLINSSCNNPNATGITATNNSTTENTTQETPTEASVPVSRGIEIIVEGWTWGGEETNQYLVTKGKITNRAGRELSFIKAKVTYYSKDDKFITSDTAYIDPQTMRPGDSGSFEIMTSYDERVKGATIDFSDNTGVVEHKEAK